MTDSERFEIDFSEAKKIPADLSNTRITEPRAARRLENIWGFSAPTGHNNASGPCALGTILHFYGIGWNHLPKEQDGRPVNDPFIEEVIRWSTTPNLLSGSLGTSPGMMLQSLHKAELCANWYAGNPPERTMQLVEHEIKLGQPVIVVIGHAPSGHPLLLEWQVAFQIKANTIRTKHCAGSNAEKLWTIDEFLKSLQMDLPQLSGSVITVQKE
ncbi:MAG: hypothetical protein RLO04_09710 [Limnobacter sp.]|uniref:hypothetical protein n=1 Tax=Limnobacter sp. TaxID=2003368 RepID=UPI0032F02EBB